MDSSEPVVIWPPFEAFYLEALLFSTITALDAAASVETALDTGAAYEPSSSEWQEAALAIVNGVQRVAHQAGAVSRYLWPPTKSARAQARGMRLRDGLGVSDSSPLRNRELRNSLEHFDERLDAFCSGLVAGRILPTYVGPLGKDPEVPTYLFRAYYTNVGVFEVLGKRFEMLPILDALRDLHNRLVLCTNAGGRIPDRWSSNLEADV